MVLPLQVSSLSLSSRISSRPPFSVSVTFGLRGPPRNYNHLFTRFSFRTLPLSFRVSRGESRVLSPLSTFRTHPPSTGSRVDLVKNCRDPDAGSPLSGVVVWWQVVSVSSKGEEKRTTFLQSHYTGTGFTL